VRLLGLILCDIITTGYDAWYLFIIPMPAYILEFYIYCILFMACELKTIIQAYCSFWWCYRYLITLATSPHLIVENTMMVILLTLPIVVLFIMAKMGKI
jgi:hypothetical protein